MRLLHAAAKTQVRFDDPNLVSLAGLVPERLMRNVESEELVAQHVRVAGAVSANPAAKVTSLLRG